MKKIVLFIFTTFVLNVLLFSQTFDWVKQFKCSGNFGSASTTILTNSLGELFVAGYYRDTVDFDPSVNNLNLISSGSSSSFVCKLDTAGELIWVKELKGTSDVVTTSMAFDNQENLILIGYFGGYCDFDSGTNSIYLTADGGVDIFVEKITSDGDFVWVKNIGGSNNEIAGKVVIDDVNNIYFSGSFNSATNLDPGFSNFSLTTIGYQDAFVCKLNDFGNFVWAKQIGGLDQDNIYDISIDLANNIYIGGGFFDACSFDSNGINFQLSSNGTAESGFISKWNSSGNLIWAESVGGTGATRVKKITINEIGDIYVLGGFKDSMDVDFSNNVFQLATTTSSRGSFILKIDSTSNFIWAKQVVSSTDMGHVDIYGSTIDEFGNLYLTGKFNDIVDFNPNSGVFNLFSDYESDVFILKINSLGNFEWVTQFVDNNQITQNFSYSIALDKQNNVYTTGTFTTFCDFDPGLNTYYFSNSFNPSMFVHKLNQNSVGISENMSLNNLNIYPNPSDGIFYIQTKSSKPQKLLLSNITGEFLIESKTIENKTQLDISKFAAGIYFLKIDESTIKLIKK